MLPLYRKFDLKVILLVRKPDTMMDSRLRLWKNYRELGWGWFGDPGFKELQKDCDRYKSKGDRIFYHINTTELESGSAEP